MIKTLRQKPRIQFLQGQGINTYENSYVSVRKYDRAQNLSVFMLLRSLVVCVHAGISRCCCGRSGLC